MNFVRRDESILDHIDPKGRKILEIGPLYRPLVERVEGKVFFADHCSHAELKEKYKNDPLVSQMNIAPVDFVISDGDLETSCRREAPYDVIIASHVIEHVPNLVGWLLSVHNLLSERGILCLAVPDKRFTFDYLRRLSTIKDADEAHAENRRRPSLDTVCDSYRNVIGIEPGSLWQRKPDLNTNPVGWPSHIVREKIDAYLRGEYVDVHCWVFTPWQFISLLGHITTKYNLNYDLRYFRTTQPNEEEFHVQLVKTNSMLTKWAELSEFYREYAARPTFTLQDV